MIHDYSLDQFSERKRIGSDHVAKCIDEKV